MDWLDCVDDTLVTGLRFLTVPLLCFTSELVLRCCISEYVGAVLIRIFGFAFEVGISAIVRL